MFYSVKVAEMTGIKNFLAYGTFFGSFWKTLQSLSIPFANFSKIKLSIPFANFWRSSTSLLCNWNLRSPIKTITEKASETLSKFEKKSGHCWKACEKAWRKFHGPATIFLSMRLPQSLQRGFFQVFSLLTTGENWALPSNTSLMSHPKPWQNL